MVAFNSYTWYLIGAFLVALIPYSLLAGGEYTPIQSFFDGEETPSQDTVTQSPDFSTKVVSTLRLILESIRCGQSFE